MILEQTSSSSNKELLEWIEPVIRQLDVRETAIAPSTGADGQTHYPDCTRS